MYILEGIDVVINCVGVLQASKKSQWTIHYETPKLILKLCAKVNVKQCIQISALGVEEAKAEFAKTKKAFDDYLMKQNLVNAIVIRPSLVYGSGSYGGTSLFRGMAALALIPIPAKGRQKFQPIHIEDLATAVNVLLEKDNQHNQSYDAVGPKIISFKDLLSSLKKWLGFSRARFISIPKYVMAISSKVGDIFKLATLNSTTFNMLFQDNISSKEETEKFHKAIGFIPKDFNQGLFSRPSHVQDRWHAKLFFLKPTLRLSIAFLWIFTAVVSLFFYPKAQSYALLKSLSISGIFIPLSLVSASIIDAILGFMTLFNYRIKIVGFLQCLLILGYSFLMTLYLPYYWLHPFAPIAKNIPLLVATLMMIAMENKR